MHGVIIAVLVIMAVAAVRQLTQEYWLHMPEFIRKRWPHAPHRS
jgi:hypothetical protein